jgi:Tfp pilus assembly protein PilF
LPLFNRASALHFAGRDKDALPDINKSIQLDGKQASAYSARGLIYEKLGEKDKAIADFRRAIALEPELQESIDGLSRLGVRVRR